MKAMRTGDVSAVTPFRYTRLLFGAGLGIIMFDETLTLGMLVGSGLIVLSGLFILWRGQKKVAVGDPAAQASESTIYPLLPYLVMHHASAEVAYLQAGGVASGFLPGQCVSTATCRGIMGLPPAPKNILKAPVSLRKSQNGRPEASAQLLTSTCTLSRRLTSSAAYRGSKR